MMFAIYSLLFIASLLALIFLHHERKNKYVLPPGPRGLPIVGYLPWLDPKQPHESLTRLTDKYGRVCGLWMGSVYTVLISDPSLVRQALAKASVSGRAPLYLTHGIMKGYGLICAEGEHWKEQRRFVATCLKNFGMVKQGTRRDKMESSILEFATEAINSLKNTKGEATDPAHILHHCIGNFMNKLVFGKVYDENDETWIWLKDIQEQGIKHIGVAGPLNFLPFLRILPHFKKVINFIKDGQSKTHQEYARIIEEHRARIKLNEDIPEEHFVASFVEEINNRKSSGDLGSFTESQFHYLLADIHGAGVDTTLTTLRWFLLFMAANPQDQEKIYQEMRLVLENREPKLEDRSDLVRLEASILEVQRLRSVVPIGIPHGTMEDTKIGDYSVPKGTMIVPLQWAIHMDSEYWESPCSFKPDRFITEDGTLAKPDAFLPFQSGKRMCVGDELAKMLLFIFAGKILWNFSISPCPSEEISLVGDCGITLVPKPHHLIFTPRSEK